jgi:hypothetical protein
VAGLHDESRQYQCQGRQIAWVSKMLGHADPSITLRIYAHAMPGSHEHVAAVMETLPWRPLEGLEAQEAAAHQAKDA